MLNKERELKRSYVTALILLSNELILLNQSHVKLLTTIILAS